MPSAGIPPVEIVGFLDNRNSYKIGIVFELDIQATRFEVLLIADGTISARRYLSMMAVMGHFGMGHLRWAVWTVVLYLARHHTRLQNNGHPRDDIRGEDSSAPRILSTSECY